MYIDFEKWHGAKNDFILCWLPEDASVLRSLQKLAPKLCSRNGDGIGADGILVLTRNPHRSELLPLRLSIINSDGSLAATCGNGIRCAALSVLKRHHEATHRVDIPEAFELPLREGVVVCRYLGKRALEQKRSRWPYVSVDMGEAQINEQHPLYAATKNLVEEKAKALNIKELTHDWALVGIGNNHLVFYLNQASRDLLLKIGPAFQESDLWDGVNVHLAVASELDDELRRRSGQDIGETVDEVYDVLVWERGAGETQACGSGACAVVKGIIHSGLVDRSQWIACRMPGGVLYGRQQEDDDPMTLAGPGELAFTGTFEL